MSTRIDGWSLGDVVGTLEAHGCDLMVCNGNLHIGRCSFFRTEGGGWVCSAGGYYRDTPILEEMIAAQQGTTAAGTRLIYAWDGWICGKASAEGGEVDSGEGRPSSAVCPFRVGDVVEYVGVWRREVVNPCTIILADHGDDHSRVTDANGMVWTLLWSRLRKVEPTPQESVATEHGTFRKGDPVMVKRYGRTLKGTVCEVDPTDPVRPARVRLPDIGQRWILAEHLAHA